MTEPTSEETRAMKTASLSTWKRVSPRPEGQLYRHFLAERRRGKKKRRADHGGAAPCKGRRCSSRPPKPGPRGARRTRRGAGRRSASLGAFHSSCMKPLTTIDSRAKPSMARRPRRPGGSREDLLPYGSARKAMAKPRSYASERRPTDSMHRRARCDQVGARIDRLAWNARHVARKDRRAQALALGRCSAA